ncbi:unnamed protein product [Mytilus coruscus]|uniref:Uncharacterized protein n=1 Tax=Mytilus coruscus TaxID=42192 RepID=A0A6J8ALB8_MYTCO|nr:unnamed protein product [Mytilus coruscus]
MRCILAVCDILTQIMREYMEQSGTPPTRIERLVLGNKTFKRHLYAKEIRDILTLPAEGFKQFDFSLMYKIAKEEIFSFLISDIPTRGWGADPKYNECTIGDNIERIRNCRNALSHMAYPLISKAEFDVQFTRFIDIAQRADKHLQTRTFEQKIQQYKTCFLDEEMKIKFDKFVEEARDLKSKRVIECNEYENNELPIRHLSFRDNKDQLWSLTKTLSITFINLQ